MPHAYERGQVIFYQGNPALAAFCVRSGLVKLSRQFDHGEATVVGLRTAGEFFGYRTLLAESPYEMSAEAVEPSVVCTIPRTDLVALLEESHDLALHLVTRLAREYALAEEQLAERGCEPVLRRTARFLVRLTEASPAGATAGERVGVPARREDLALLLGTTPETLSRTLHGLARRGLVRVDRKEVQVLNLAALRQLAR